MGRLRFGYEVLILLCQKLGGGWCRGVFRLCMWLFGTGVVHNNFLKIYLDMEDEVKFLKARL